MALMKIRTLKGAADDIRANDPNTAFTEYYLRNLVKQGKIPAFYAGRKCLINLDVLIEYLSNTETMKDTEVLSDYGTIRKVLE